MIEYKIISRISVEEHKAIKSENLTHSEMLSIITSQYGNGLFSVSDSTEPFIPFWKKFINKEKDKDKLRDLALNTFESERPEEFKRKSDTIDKLFLGDDAIAYLAGAYLRDRNSLRYDGKNIQKDSWEEFLCNIWRQSLSDEEYRNVIAKALKQNKMINKYNISLKGMSYDEIERLLNYYGNTDWRYRSLQYTIQNGIRILEAIILEKELDN